MRSRAEFSGENGRDLVLNGKVEFLHVIDARIADQQHVVSLLLLDTNPRAILEDRALYEVDPLPIHESLWGKMRRVFGSSE